MRTKTRVQRWYRIINNFKQSQKKIEQLEKNVINLLNSNFEKLGSDKRQKDKLKGKEFQIYSQNGEDGLLLYIFSCIGTTNKSIVEIGIGNGTECNSRNLIENYHWNGVLIDGSMDKVNVARSFYNNICADNTVEVKNCWVTVENIDSILLESGMNSEIDLLSIDNWVWNAIECISPRAVIIEYNASFGPDESVTVPYDPNFERFNKHKSGYYHGASLSALNKLGNKKGYSLICCDSMGTNAIFLRNDLLKIFEFIFSVETPNTCFYPLEKRLETMSIEDQFQLIKHLDLVTL